MVLVYGAAGMLGEEICRRLRKHGKRVRAMMPRNAPPAAHAALKEIDVDLIVADVCEIPAVAAACSGEESVVCADPALAPYRDWPPMGADGVRCLVEFSRILGVREFVFVSVPERFSTPCALVEARDECFDRMDSHRMNHVAIETGFLMETWLHPDSGFDYLNGSAAVFGEGTQAVPWVACQDVAEMVARSVGADHRQKHHIRMASENMSLLDAARVFEEQRGSPMTINQIPETQLRAEHKSARAPADRVLAAMKLELAKGLPMRADRDEIPFALTSIGDYARVALGAGQMALRNTEPAD